ncbi:tetraacyldisaccharide 4'-kinase [Aquabacterium sp. A7-Y]|uniref:tetraacyldisaccharide 4'-kinase n=1 Tax=Aquabacterium sp. A7-Y TaxID=1349605 RepID=UPI00223CAC2B|nr:tetraacyldisaccharide 4'-kinase [Aquabacterium sp. A7-Y]MCW7537765.1 tetraacyldisaccharide 4'-kinase [Aquabacterium sp. A7-Y]
MTDTPGWQQRIEAAWLARGPLACALLPVTALYAALVLLRRALFALGLLHREALPVPVIVVGNVIAGGAGKTPTTIAVVQHLRRRGEHPAIVSRGYGRESFDITFVTPHSRVREVGDEPLLMCLRTGVPVAVSADRVEAARALLTCHPETTVIVCDDGLQHLRLARDIEVLVFDERGTGNGWWLPAGPLRESAGRRADLVLYNAPAASTARPGYLARRRLGEAVPLARWRQGAERGLPLASLVARRVLAVAAVAHPQRFFGMLKAEGLAIERCPLPDHHDYAKQPPWTGWPGEVVLVTEKDAVKLRDCDDPRVHVVALDFAPEAAFFAALDALLAGRSNA